MSREGGFTIVELLIVIVVIAALAGVTIVAYNGVQQRAKNTARVAAVQKMLRLLELYKAGNGSSAFKSDVPGTFNICIGEEFEDLDPGSGVACRSVYDNVAGTTTYSSPLIARDTALKTVGDYKVAYPKVSYTGPLGNNVIVTAPTFGYHTSATVFVDGVPSRYGGVSYVLDGTNQDCVIRPQLVNTGTNQFSAQSATTIGTTSGSATLCMAYFHPDA